MSRRVSSILGLCLFTGFASLALALPGVAHAQGTTPNFGQHDTPACE